jgi:hypothetical protein
MRVPAAAERETSYLVANDIITEEARFVVLVTSSFLLSLLRLPFCSPSIPVPANYEANSSILTCLE